MSKNNEEEGRLKSEIQAFQEGINQQAAELKNKQDSRKQLIDELNLIRCRSILRDIDRIIKDFLKLQQPFETLKGKVLEIQASDSAWWKLPQQLGEDGLYTQIADDQFRPDRIKGLDLLTFIQKVRTFSSNKDKPLFKFK